MARSAFEGAEAWAIAPLGWAELQAAIQNRGRRGHMDPLEVNSALDRASAHWQTFYQVDSLLALPHVAPVCARHPLRGADAWHLSSALGLREQLGNIAFMSADRLLNAAALSEGLRLIAPLDE